ncbi:unnamed protein product, partial [Meganyctiphanes norvegica]
LIVANQDSDIFRALCEADLSYKAVSLENEALAEDAPYSRKRLAELHAEEGIFGCRAIVLELTTNTQEHGLSVLEEFELFKYPKTSVVLLETSAGGMSQVEQLFAHTSLRNCINLLYLARVAVDTGNKLNEHPIWKVYNRCLYCNQGDIEATVVDTWDPHSGFKRNTILFPDQFTNMDGHEISIVSKSWDPLIRYTIDRTDGNLIVQPKDSSDLRIIDAMAEKLNFTYIMREPRDGKWGILMPDGNHSGRPGELQHGISDIASFMVPTLSRYPDMEFSNIYTYEPFMIITLKPQPLDIYLSIVRPFS